MSKFNQCLSLEDFEKRYQLWQLELKPILTKIEEKKSEFISRESFHKFSNSIDEIKTIGLDCDKENIDWKVSKDKWNKNLDPLWAELLQPYKSNIKKLRWTVEIPAYDLGIDDFACLIPYGYPGPKQSKQKPKQLSNKTILNGFDEEDRIIFSKNFFDWTQHYSQTTEAILYEYDDDKVFRISCEISNSLIEQPQVSVAVALLKNQKLSKLIESVPRETIFEFDESDRIKAINVREPEYIQLKNEKNRSQTNSKSLIGLSDMKYKVTYDAKGLVDIYKHFQTPGIEGEPYAHIKLTRERCYKRKERKSQKPSQLFAELEKRLIEQIHQMIESAEFDGLLAAVALMYEEGITHPLPPYVVLCNQDRRSEIIEAGLGPWSAAEYSEPILFNDDSAFDDLCDRVGKYIHSENKWRPLRVLIHDVAEALNKMDFKNSDRLAPEFVVFPAEARLQWNEVESICAVARPSAINRLQELKLI